MESLVDQFVLFLQPYAYQPVLVYGFVFIILILASFGLPFPEEVVIISAGLMVHFALHPERYPPPPGHTGVSVNLYTMMGVGFASVWLSDFVVFMLGRHLGGWLLSKDFFKSLWASKSFRRSRAWVRHRGLVMAALFRFMPGVRFPGHFSCGALRLSPIKFFLVDGLIVLLTVPTQIYLIATYGHVVIDFMKKWKFLVMSILALILVYVLVKAYLQITKKKVFTASFF